MTRLTISGLCVLLCGCEAIQTLGKALAEGGPEAAKAGSEAGHQASEGLGGGTIGTIGGALVGLTVAGITIYKTYKRIKRRVESAGS